MDRNPGLWAVATLALFITASPPAMAQTPGGAAPSVQAPLVSDPDYALGEGDIVDVVVVGSAEFSARARIANDGAILLPLLGPVKAGGISPGRLADNIADALKKGGYFANPVVRVELVGIRSRYVTVLGSVGTPGMIPLDRPYRLSEILARIGGRGSGGASYIIVTSSAGAQKRYPIEQLATGGPDQDPVVQSGDKIYIPPAQDEIYYLNGEVKSPGPFPVQNNLTVRIAIAMAGGVTPNGSEKKVKIVRKGQELRPVTLETKLEPGDVVTVGARMF